MEEESIEGCLRIRPIHLFLSRSISVLHPSIPSLITFLSPLIHLFLSFFSTDQLLRCIHIDQVLCLRERDSITIYRPSLLHR